MAAAAAVSWLPDEVLYSNDSKNFLRVWPIYTPKHVNIGLSFKNTRILPLMSKISSLNGMNKHPYSFKEVDDNPLQSCNSSGYIPAIL